MEPAVINLDEMFPGLEHQGIRYVLHLCGLRDIPSHQTRLINYEGIETVEGLANYTDAKLDTMTDRNLKCTPVPNRVEMGLARTKTLKAITHWVHKKLSEGVDCDLHELTPPAILELITKLNASKGKKDYDSKLYYPDSFTSTDYKNWIKKVENYLDAAQDRKIGHATQLCSPSCQRQPHHECPR